MAVFEDEIIAEVRRHRAELLDDYGGLEGYMKHVYEEQTRRERECRYFTNPSGRTPTVERRGREA